MSEPVRVTPVRVTPAQVVATADGLAVNVSGALIPVTMLDGYTPGVNDVVQVLIVDGRAVLLGASYKAPAADADGPASEPAPPRAKSSTGRLDLTATSSGSWRSGYGIWQSGDVRQGSYGGGHPYNGAWFYPSGQVASLRGKTITGVKVRVGKRLRIGSFNAALSLQLYAHDSTGHGNPHETDGPHSRSIPAHSSARWIDLPTSVGEALRDAGHGGIAISGGSYGGVAGRHSDAASGQLRIYWRKD